MGEGQVVLFLTWRFQEPDVIGVWYAPQPFVMSRCRFTVVTVIYL